MISSSELIQKLRSYHSNLNESLIQKAYLFAKDAHGNQKRHSGDLYFSHPVAVAEILTELRLDQESVVAALLHDVAEDTEITLDEIKKNFGEEVAKLVEGLTKLDKIESLPNNERVAENFRKLTLAMSQDIRILIIKIVDRLHNMRTISYLPSKEKRIKKASESLEIYAPLAGRMGLNQIKDELQDLSFAIINPEARNQILKKLSEIREQNKDLVEKITNNLKEIFLRDGLECKIYGREKKPYSIWMKMKINNVGFYGLYDIIAFRVIVEDLKSCYRALGIINSNFSMIPGSFSDYISTPKENGYQSLHLKILGPFNQKIEVQIRDQKMHEAAELGVAAHWHYKEQSFLNLKKEEASLSQPIKSQVKSRAEKDQYYWISDLISLFENAENASDVLKNHKLEMHVDEVFCFTPNGDIFNLPKGATLVDFAYAVHSEVGNFCVAAKVNGVTVNLRQKLENGDQVEIITAKNSKPSPNWLQFVATSKARSAIKHFIRNQKFAEYSVLGRAILNRFFASKNLEIDERILEKVLPIFHKKTVADLCFKIADGAISRQEILKAVYPDFTEESSANKATKESKIISNKASNFEEESKNFLPIEGVLRGMSVSYAACCRPIPGDSIIGIISVGSGVAIHNQLCKNIKNFALSPQKLLDVCWKSGTKNEKSDLKDERNLSQNYYASAIRVIVGNKSGALASVTSVIAKKKINIIHIKTINSFADTFEVTIDIEVKDLDQLEEIISSLRSAKTVVLAKRVACS